MEVYIDRTNAKRSAEEDTHDNDARRKRPTTEIWPVTTGCLNNVAFLASDTAPSAMNSGSALKPFRFLDLSKELRLMVYEFLPIETKHHTFTSHCCPYHNETPGGTTFSYTAVSKSLSVSVLATCRFVNGEASAIIERKLRKLLVEPPKIVLDAQDAFLLGRLGGGPLYDLMSEYRRLESLPAESLKRSVDLHNEDNKNKFLRLACMHMKYYDLFPEDPLSTGKRFHAIEIGIIDEKGTYMGRDLQDFVTSWINHRRYTGVKDVTWKFRLVSPHLIDYTMADRVRACAPVGYHAKGSIRTRPENASQVCFCEDVGEEEWNANWAEGKRFQA